MRITTARVTLLVLLGALSWLQFRLWISPEGMPEVWRLQRTVQQQSAQNEQLSTRNARLYAEVNDLREGLEAAEERARQDLGMVGEGESFYQVLDAPVADEEFQPPE